MDSTQSKAISGHDSFSHRTKNAHNSGELASPLRSQSPAHGNLGSASPAAGNATTATPLPGRRTSMEATGSRRSSHQPDWTDRTVSAASDGLGSQSSTPTARHLAPMGGTGTARVSLTSGSVRSGRSRKSGKGVLTSSSRTLRPPTGSARADSHDGRIAWIKDTVCGALAVQPEAFQRMLNAVGSAMALQASARPVLAPWLA